MKLHQQPDLTILFYVASAIVLICVSSVIASWEERDGMKLIVPKRMAKLLTRITKHKLNSIGKSIRNAQINSMDGEDIQTILRHMNFNGLRIRYPNHETRNATEVFRRLTSDKSASRRLRRGVLLNKTPKKAKLCGSVKIHVDLTKYTNIVYPSGFKTVYCGIPWYPLPIGSDPVTKIISKAIVKAIKMQNLTNLVFRNSKCCVPSRAKNLIVLYNDSKKNYSMIKNVSKVIGRSCACPLG